MDIVTYALAKKLISSALTGIADAKVIDNDLIITTNDGQNFTIGFPQPSDYKVKNVDIDRVTGNGFEINQNSAFLIFDNCSINNAFVGVVFGPNIDTFDYEITEIFDEDGDSISVARHPQMIVKIPVDFVLNKNDMMRLKVFDI